MNYKYLDILRFRGVTDVSEDLLTFANWETLNRNLDIEIRELVHDQKESTIYIAKWIFFYLLQARDQIDIILNISKALFDRFKATEILIAALEVPRLFNCYKGQFNDETREIDYVEVENYDSERPPNGFYISLKDNISSTVEYYDYTVRYQAVSVQIDHLYQPRPFTYSLSMNCTFDEESIKDYMLYFYFAQYNKTLGQSENKGLGQSSWKQAVVLFKAFLFYKEPITKQLFFSQLRKQITFAHETVQFRKEEGPNIIRGYPEVFLVTEDGYSLKAPTGLRLSRLVR